jgi:hypothetical protein
MSVTPLKKDMDAARKQLAPDQGPSTKDQSSMLVQWDRVLGTIGTNPFDSTNISFEQMYQMRRDAMLSFALHYRRVPLVRAKWSIKCERADIASFIDNALRRIIGRYIMQDTQRYDFGFQPMIKRFSLETPDWMYVDPKESDPTKSYKRVWDNGPVKALVWDNFLPLPPEKCWPEWTENGEFNGIKYAGMVNLSGSTITAETESSTGAPESLIDLAHSMWTVNEQDAMFGSVWGYPATGYAWKYYWSYEYLWSLANRFFEKHADPPMIGYHPDDYIDENGVTTSMSSAMLNAMRDARSGSNIALPSGTVNSLDQDRMTSVRQWEIKPMEVGGNPDWFRNRFDDLQVMKLRAIWVPEQAFVEGSGGSSSRNVMGEAIDTFEEGTAVEMGIIDDRINKYLIPQLVQANFPEFEGVCEKVTSGFQQEDFALARQLVQLKGQADPGSLKIDMDKLLDTMGMPLMSPEQIEAERERLIKEAALAAPTPGQPIDGVAAGAGAPNGQTQMPAGDGGGAAPANNGAQVAPTVTGFSNIYTSPREVLYLSDSWLPDSLPYKNETVRENAEQLRIVWRKQLAKLYQSLIDNVDKLELADEHIVDSWKLDPSIIGATASTLGALKEFMREGGTDPESAAAQQWLEDHSATFVAGIVESLREEARKLIDKNVKSGMGRDDIKKLITEHADTAPGWKADRIARTEARMGFNAGTAIGAMGDNSLLQAVDGSSDPECASRNGKIFTPQEALAADEDEHPNGTLAFRKLPAGLALSIDRVDEMPEGMEDVRAALSGNDRVVLHHDITAEEESRYMLQLGDWLLSPRAKEATWPS